MTNSEEQRIAKEIHKTTSGSDPFAAAMRATRMPMIITDPRQHDNPIVFVNDALARLTGHIPESVAIRVKKISADTAYVKAMRLQER